MKAQNKVKRGRPVKIKWSSVVNKWRSCTDMEISNILGCTYHRVYGKRKELIAEAQKQGKSGAFYRYNGQPYDRAPSVLAKRAAAKAAV